VQARRVIVSLMNIASFRGSDRATRRRSRARAPFRLATALGAAALAVVVAAKPLEELGAAAIVTAPNNGRPPPTVALPGEELVTVGPPSATLSIRIIDSTSPRGTVFVLHGIRASKESMEGWAFALAADHFRAVLVDSRGHGRSSGDALTYGVQEARDLTTVLDTLTREGKIAGEIGVLGLSYGAATAIEWAGRDERVRAVVALAPFASLRDVVPAYTPVRLPSFIVDKALAIAGERGGFDPDQASPLEANKMSRAAVLIVHGAEDAKIPVAHARRITEAGRDHTTLVIVQGAGHDDLVGSPGANLAVRVPRWFDEHLSGT
jgi:pimeloyl-ACP methyl ester carboxylesterase